jgi:phage tail-like protein
MITYELGLFYFQLSISGEKQAFFQEASGLTMDIENEPSLPMGAKHSNLVLKRGFMAQDSILSKWCEQTLGASLNIPISPNTLSLELQNEKREKIIQWNFYNAWPVKWEIAAIENQQFILETLEFTYSYFNRS